LGNTQPPPDSNQGLYINAALGIELVQSPISQGSAAEGSVDGLVAVTRNDVSGERVMATLTVNGAEVPQQSSLGVFLGYDFAKANLPPVGPGSALTLHAELDAGSGTITLVCPPEVTITAPADGAMASTGDTVTVRWSGTIAHTSVLKPDIMVHGFDPATGARVTLDLADRVVSGKTEDTFTLPDPKGMPQWLIDLHVPGDAKSNSAGAGGCGLLRRVHLVKR
jgi:hypothetical protein